MSAKVDTPSVEFLCFRRPWGEVGIELMALDADSVERQAPLHHVGNHPGEQGVFVGDHVGMGFVDPQLDARDRPRGPLRALRPM